MRIQGRASVSEDSLEMGYGKIFRIFDKIYLFYGRYVIFSRESLVTLRFW